jgi:hypothetical protein
LNSTESPAASSIQVLRSTISAAVLDDGAVLLDLNSKYFYALNASGWAIAQVLESGASFEDVLRRTGAWGADAADVRAFLTELQRYGLLEASAGAGETAEVTWEGPWAAPTLERQSEPLQTIMVSAFDPSIPLAE